MPRRPLALAFPMLLAATAQAQFLNRAVWLGDDEEGVRRNFDQGTEYFLDRFSYVSLPPWWNRGLERFGSGALLRVGSVTGTEFTFENTLDIAQELGDGVTFRYHWLQSEHRDARFVTNAIGLDYALNDRMALFAQGTPFADKSRIDVSAGAWLHRDGPDALRVMMTMVDAPRDKNEVVDYETPPYGVHVAGAFGDPDSHRVAFELGAQLPFEQRRIDDDERFEMWRVIGTIDAQLRLGDTDWLSMSIEGERTQKELTPATAGDPLQEDFDRDFVQVRTEWWRDVETPWSIGFLHTHHGEHGRRPNDPANDLRTQRREWMGIFRLKLQVGEKLSFEPQLFAGHVQDAYRDGVEERDRERFEGKIAWNARWDFSPQVTLALVVSTQVDELAFGGGGAQFVARF